MKKDVRPALPADSDEGDEVARNRQKMFERMNKKGNKGDNKKSPPNNKEQGKGKKAARVWDNQGHSTEGLDYSAAPPAAVSIASVETKIFISKRQFVYLRGRFQRE